MVEFSKTDDELNLGFPMVPAGRYLWQFDEGVILTDSQEEDSHAKGYRFPIVVDQPIDGDAEAEGMKGSWYVNVIKKDGEANTFGEKTINSILSMTGLVDSFSKKFDGGINIDSAKLENALAQKLPGKFLDMTHTIKKRGEHENMEFGRIAKYKKSAKATGKGKKPADDDGDDW